MKKSLLFLLFVFMASTPKSFAVHGSLVSSHLNYKHISKNKYQLSLTFYRDCTHTSNLDSVEITTRYNDSILRTELWLYKTSSIDVTPVCSTVTSACGGGSSSIGIGVEKIIYQGYIDLDSSPYKQWIDNGLCKLNFSFTGLLRAESSNLGTNLNYYIETIMYLCNIKKTQNKINNSIQFTNHPILNECCNTPIHYNNGAIDTTDHDSLSYELTSAKNTFYDDAKYLSPYSPQTPLTPKCIPNYSVNCKAIPNASPPLGTFLDPFNGDFVVTPTNCNEISSVAFLVKEWRKDSSGKYLLVSSTMRDFQVRVSNCASNWPPVISALKNFHTVCEGDEVVIEIDGKDHPHPSDPNGRKDNVSLTWNGALASKGTFKIIDPNAREKKAKFTWKTKIGDAHDIPYNFVVSAQDDACPLNEVSSEGISIMVLARPISTKRTFSSSCDKLYLNSDSKANTNGPLYHFWEIYDSAAPNILLARAINQNDSVVLQKASTYYVKLTLNNNNNCLISYWDTLTINPIISPLNLGPDRLIAYRDTLVLNAGSGMQYYHWSDGSMDSTLKVFGRQIHQTKTYSVEVKDQLGCLWEDEVKFTFDNCSDNQAPTITTLKDNYNLCAGDTLKFLITTNDTTPSQYPNGRLDTTFLTWLNPMVGGNLELLNSSGRLQSGIFTFVSTVSDSNKVYKPQFVVKEDGCSKDSALKTIEIHQKSLANGTFNNVLVCGEYSMKVNLKSGSNEPVKYLWEILDKSNNNQVFSSSLERPIFTVTKNSNYIINLTLENNFGCMSTLHDTVVLQPYVNKNLLETSRVLFKHESTVIRAPQSQSYLWNDGSSADTLKLIGKNFPEGNKRITLYVLGLDGCEYKDSMIVQVKCLPNQLDLGNNLTLDIWDSVTLKANKNFISYLWFNQSKQNHLKINGHLLGTGTHSIGLTAVDSFGCTYQDQVEITVTNTTDIQKTEPTKLQVYPSPTKKSITLELENGMNGATVYIYNVIGNLMLQKTLDANIENRHTFDIGAFPKGLYLIKVRKGEMEYTTKVVKE